MTIEWLAGNRLRGTTAERPNLGLPSGSVGGWKELGRASNASLPNVTGLADKRYLMFLNFQESNNSRPAPAIRINGDTDPNYARRGSANGLSDYTNIDQTEIMFGGQPEGDTTTVPYFTVGYIANKSDKEKLAMCHNVLSYQLGASGSDPLERRETAFKWDITSESVDQLSITNFLSGSFNTNGELIVLGWDPTDTHTTNFWEELASVEISGNPANWDSGTFAAKKYLWIQVYHKPSGIGSGTAWHWLFNADSGTNYAQRQSYNGGADSTNTSLGYFSAHYNHSTPQFENMFIVNNSSNEKLIISHLARGETAGAGTAPSRFEKIGKWANTASQITSLTSERPTGAGTIGDGSWMKVWGAD